MCYIVPTFVTQKIECTMATVQWTILKHQKKEDGTFNPKIVITHNRKRAYMPTGIYTSFVRFKRGSSKGTLTDKSIEEALNDKVARIRAILNEHEEMISSMCDVSEVRDFVTRSLDSGKSIDFMTFASDHIKSIRNEGTRFYHESRLRTFASFIEETRGCERIPVTEINSKLVKDYAAWLKSSKRRRGKGYGIADSTIRTYICARNAV